MQWYHDITAFKATIVPVGEDQAPLIEQTNEIVRRINRQAGRDVFVEAQALIPRVGRLPGIDGKSKMSKSQGNAIPLSASPDQISEAIKRMFTDPNHLRASEITMADVFKHNSYDTAMFGKWHLGANYPYRPMDRGFDEWLGLGDGGTNTSDCYFWNDRVNDMYWHNGEREYREGFNPDVFFGAAMDYVKDHDGESPFL